MSTAASRAVSLSLLALVAAACLAVVIPPLIGMALFTGRSAPAAPHAPRRAAAHDWSTSITGGVPAGSSAREAR